jgi:hypothetical protein
MRFLRAGAGGGAAVPARAGLEANKAMGTDREQAEGMASVLMTMDGQAKCGMEEKAAQRVTPTGLEANKAMGTDREQAEGIGTAQHILSFPRTKYNGALKKVAKWKA